MSEEVEPSKSESHYRVLWIKEEVLEDEWADNDMDSMQPTEGATSSDQGNHIEDSNIDI